MRRWLNDLDRVLRGEATRLAALREESIEIPLGGLLLVILLLAMLYGACMGFFAGFRADGPFCMQWFASTVKVPSLFLLTLVVTFPSLYVFNALVGSRLNLVAVLQLLVASLAVNVAVLASLGPIVAFFSVSTTSYPFAVLLNVTVFTISGFLGLAFLLQTLHRLSVARHLLPPRSPSANPHGGKPAEAEAPQAETGERSTPNEAESSAEPSALDALEGHVLDRHVKTVFLSWMVIFGLVGADGVGAPPLYRQSGGAVPVVPRRESNFFEAVWQTLRALL